MKQVCYVIQDTDTLEVYARFDANPGGWWTKQLGNVQVFNDIRRAQASIDAGRDKMRMGTDFDRHMKRSPNRLRKMTVRPMIMEVV